MQGLRPLLVVVCFGAAIGVVACGDSQVKVGSSNSTAVTGSSSSTTTPYTVPKDYRLVGEKILTASGDGSYSADLGPIPSDGDPTASSVGVVPHADGLHISNEEASWSVDGGQTSVHFTFDVSGTEGNAVDLTVRAIVTP